jgi:putative ABC transport system permease protein
MLTNYLKIAWRNLIRNKTISLITIAGLAIGLTTSLFILEYVCFERSYDSFNSQAADIYRLQYNQVKDDGTITAKATTFASVGRVIWESIPEVTSMVRFHRSGALLSYEANRQKRLFREENILAVDTSFLTFFSFPLLKGDPATSLREPHSIVLTQTMARKYFGRQNPIGKTIKMMGGYGDWSNSADQNASYYTVTGVLADIPTNSHLKINALVSFRRFSRGEAEFANWGDSFYTYLKLRPGASASVVADRLPLLTKQVLGETSKDGFALQPLTAIHLDSDLLGELETNGSRLMVSALLLAALFISLIAWINYINLATARATERAKEVGVRKVAGASGRNLFGQFLVEAIVLNVLSLVLALVLSELMQPAFNELVGLSLSSRLLTTQTWLLVGVGLFVGGGLLSSLYPIFVNTTFPLSSVLRGQPKSPGQAVPMRKGLVVLQFSLAILLIVGSLIMYRQLTFMQRADVGIKLQSRLVLEGPASTDSTYESTVQRLKSDLLRYPAIRNITVSNLIPGKRINGYSDAGFVRRLDQQPEVSSGRYYFSQVDYDFLRAFGTRLRAGRWFSTAYSSDATSGQSVVINETAARQLGYANPADAVGKRINYRVQSTPMVIGVLNDYHHLSLKTKIDPIIFELQTAPNGFYTISISPDDLPQTVAMLQQKWRATFPDSPFSYFFLADSFDKQYVQEAKTTQIAGLFAVLSIVVASLGLFGLAMFTAEQRTKEIGVRKVLGASVASIVTLLSKDFLKLVLVAIVIASPIAYYAMHRWLQDFAYRVDIAWWVFALAGLLAVGIALLTVSFQSIRAALVNPVKSLRSE